MQMRLANDRTLAVESDGERGGVVLTAADCMSGVKVVIHMDGTEAVALSAGLAEAHKQAK